jgi:hypothetical protein
MVLASLVAVLLLAGVLAFVAHIVRISPDE